ncbi:putative transcriptional regulatory protein [Penicillium chrysogenum]|uniref:Pc22g06580 protein n=2 Tax=Penicillium chrysogenum species complex TaxID=254878 RepID=B6HPU8_PENRW|nr:putative transcriptional regulatory protein [Penicillium chrysogenum]CAP97946.1 Pc22g06580 [Penicillium rubens Wisconsin 54-1255]
MSENAEKDARSDPSGRNTTSLKPRSCIVCRSRKVRCDKRAPCSNCRRANSACVLPPTDRPPRWARRLDRLNGAVSNLHASQEAEPVAEDAMERLHNLESLVQELRVQLEQAKLATNSAAEGSSGVGSPENSAHDRQSNVSSISTANVQNKFGRMVLQGSNRSRYVSSGFWSRVNDEIDDLRADACGLLSGESDTSDEEASPGMTPSTHELERAPAERHGFLFGHNLSPFPPNLTDIHPLPSQIPFLLDVFSENVNIIFQVVHLPTIKNMVRDWRGREMKGLTPTNEALMFSIYYAAITSMEEEDVVLNFGATKADLNLKYRQGLEYALARADFLNAPNFVLVQAFAIFLSLARRHDSPSFVWMMTGLAIRMGQALGIHRDGTHFNNLSPYQTEMRRRVWWTLCMLDVRASEDQGTDYTITRASFDTKIPLNLNDADLDPESKQTPQAHDALTDMSVARVSFGMCEITRQMMAYGFKEAAPSLEEQSRLLQQIYQGLERDFLQYSTDSGNIVYWVVVTVARLLMAKMTLLIHLPLLFSSPNEDFSEELRTRLLVSSIEVAEYNHALNNEQACRHWRWAFQTYTHWYSIVYMMLEISRRPWSPLSERAWVALHSQWLIPNQSHMNRNLRVWIPLRKLMTKARKYRDMEFGRLRNDPRAAEELEQGYRFAPLPSSTGPFPPGSDSADLFLDQWRQLVIRWDENKDKAPTPGFSVSTPSNPPTAAQSIVHPAPNLSETHSSAFAVGPEYLAAEEPQFGYGVPSIGPTNFSSVMEANTGFGSGHINPAAHGQLATPAVVPWLWSDEGVLTDFTSEEQADSHVDMGEEVNWYNWASSAKDMEHYGGTYSTRPH